MQDKLSPSIQACEEKKLIGFRTQMSLSRNTTGLLWQKFMKLRQLIQGRLNTNYYSLQVFDPNYFKAFNPTQNFEKWACVEVENFDTIPDGMEIFVLESGKYAVFHYKGKASQGAELFKYIFEAWLPNSGYKLAQRPHFEILQADYQPESEYAEEEIWIPID